MNESETKVNAMILEQEALERFLKSRCVGLSTHMLETQAKVKELEQKLALAKEDSERFSIELNEEKMKSEMLSNANQSLQESVNSLSGRLERLQANISATGMNDLVPLPGEAEGLPMEAWG